MKKLSIYILCLLIAVLPACQLTEAQRESGRIAVNDAYDRGEITAVQRDDAIEALEGGSVDWEKWLMLGGTVLVSVLTGVPIAVNRTMKKRGPPAPPAERAARAAAQAASKPA
jgi:hypothetical protein